MNPQRAISGGSALALVSGGEKIDPSAKSSSYADHSHSKCSDLLWSLWRFGVTRMIAPPKQLMGLEFSRNHLNRPPERPKHDVELLSDLCQRQSLQLHGEAGDTPQDHWLLTPPWPQGVDLLPIPEEPYLLDGLKLCFHDELIGVDDALLIHYGPSQYEVNGYHPVISALSVPIEVELSALIILRMERREAQRWVDFPLTRERETCVIHISAQGALIKGPWWPKLNVPSRQGEHGSTLG